MGLELREYIRSVPDFPKLGVNFKDIFTLTRNPAAFANSVERLSALVMANGRRPNKLGILDARGFIFGTGVALHTELPFFPLRKDGKLPPPVISITYDLEYGTSTLQMQEDAVQEGDLVALIDDILATGGTIAASAELVKRRGGIITGCYFLGEIRELGGRAKLAEHDVRSLIQY